MSGVLVALAKLRFVLAIIATHPAMTPPPPPPPVVSDYEIGDAVMVVTDLVTDTTTTWVLPETGPGFRVTARPDEAQVDVWCETPGGFLFRYLGPDGGLPNSCRGQ